MSCPILGRVLPPSTVADAVEWGPAGSVGSNPADSAVPVGWGRHVADILHQVVGCENHPMSGSALPRGSDGVAREGGIVGPAMMNLCDTDHRAAGSMSGRAAWGARNWHP
jgi:hypothetical protein